MVFFRMGRGFVARCFTSPARGGAARGRALGAELFGVGLSLTLGACAPQPAQAPLAATAEPTLVHVPEPKVSPVSKESLVLPSRCVASPRTPKQIRVREVRPSEDDPLAGRFDMQQALDGLSGGFPLVATLETSHGVLRCELWDDVAPITVANFVGLARGLRPFRDPVTKRWVRRPAYNGVIFHRIIAGFMIQGGDPSGLGSGDPGYVIPDEIDPQVGAGVRGTLFMANRGRDTNGMQFFIMHEPAKHLAGRYTAFGQCGPDEVVDQIANVPASGKQNRPDEPPVIHHVTIGLDGPC